ncbi:MAG: hypothetical protein SX243_11625 [Acidobacteriota bacterium]|nr:hypothetical protein [Acidobacteriota bacterium]
MTRLFTPLVLGTTVVVSVLAIIRLVLSPDSWASSLLALAFLPLALGVMVLRERASRQPARDTRTSGKMRAAIVGAGAALAAALLLSIAEAFGFSELDFGGNWPVVGTLLIALIAVAVDLIAARLEQKASDED